MITHSEVCNGSGITSNLKIGQCTSIHNINKFLKVLMYGTYRERFSFASTGDKREPLGLDGHTRSLYMFLDVPEE